MFGKRWYESDLETSARDESDLETSARYHDTGPDCFLGLYVVKEEEDCFLAPSGLQMKSAPATEAKDTGLQGVRSIAERRANPLVVTSGCAQTPEDVPSLVPKLDLSWENLHHRASAVALPLLPSAPSSLRANTEMMSATTLDPSINFRKILIESFAGCIPRSDPPTPPWEPEPLEPIPRFDPPTPPIKPGTMDLKVEVVTAPTPSIDPATPLEVIRQENQWLKQENERLCQEMENLRLKEENDRLGLSLSLERLRQECEVDQSVDLSLPDVGNPQSAEDVCDASPNLTREVGLPNLSLQQQQCMQLQDPGAGPQHHGTLQQMHASSQLQSSPGQPQHQTTQFIQKAQQKQQQLHTQQEKQQQLHTQHGKKKMDLQPYLHRPASHSNCNQQLQPQLQKQVQQHQPLRPLSDSLRKTQEDACRDQKALPVGKACHKTPPAQVLSQHLPAPPKDCGTATIKKFPVAPKQPILVETLAKQKPVPEPARTDARLRLRVEVEHLSA